MAPTVREVLKESEARLGEVDSPRLSSELLLAAVLDCSRFSLVVDYDRQLSAPFVSQFQAFVSRRAQGEPVAYILGEKEFYGLDFTVTSDVLIPRPETEHIVEEVESLFSGEQSFVFADLGTGSGILAVTIATLFQNAHGVAVDISLPALDVASGNAVRHGVAERLEFKFGDFTKSVLEDGKYDLIVSNPPYVTEQEFADASHEVTSFEPVGALVSGADGLDHVRAMLGYVQCALKAGGTFMMEIGCGQGDDVKKIMSDQFPEFKHVSVRKDLSGHDRVVIAQKN